VEDCWEAAIIKEGERSIILTMFMMTADKPRARCFPDESIARIPDRPARKTPIIGMKIPMIDSARAEIPNAFIVLNSI